jgi:hypothetical protein
MAASYQRSAIATSRLPCCTMPSGGIIASSLRRTASRANGFSGQMAEGVAERACLGEADHALGRVVHLLGRAHLDQARHEAGGLEQRAHLFGVDSPGDAFAAARIVVERRFAQHLAHDPVHRPDMALQRRADADAPAAA